MQGPSDAFAALDGNAATSVVWNPVRKLFVAAMRYHGYYQSTDGMTWTRHGGAAQRRVDGGTVSHQYRGRSGRSIAPSFAARWR